MEYLLEQLKVWEDELKFYPKETLEDRIVKETIYNTLEQVVDLINNR